MRESIQSSAWTTPEGPTAKCSLPADGFLLNRLRFYAFPLPFDAGDLMVAFTDGVTEALNPQEEEFGEERLKALLREVVTLPANQISARISQKLQNWIKDAAQYDDLTFIVMKVN